MEILKRNTIPVDAYFDKQNAHKKYYTAVTFDDSFQNVFNNAIPVLYSLQIPFTIFVPTSYIGEKAGWITNKQHHNYNEAVSSEEQLKKLDHNLVSIGSHTHTHKNLTHLPDKEIKKELEVSKNTLEQITNKKITMLAFPYGSHNKTVIHLSKKAGYTRAFTVTPNSIFSYDSGFIEGRIDISADDWAFESWLKIHGSYNWFGFASGIKKIWYDFTLSKTN